MDTSSITDLIEGVAVFGNNDDQNNSDSNGGMPAGPGNDFGTAMPPIEDTPFASVAAPAAQDDDNQAATEPSDQPQLNADLLSIKQNALQELTPLVGHLEQSPEEKFRTTMMMIQASDDQSLVQEAFSAAKQIQDDKARAQALLDVINEINYFTQHHK